MSDTPNIAQWRHPQMAQAAIELRQSAYYLPVADGMKQILDAIDSSPAVARVRMTHDLATEFVFTVRQRRGAAIHDMLYDHSLDEVAALVGMSRQRVMEIHREWMRRNHVDPHPAIGRQSRIAARKRADLEDS